MALSWNEFDHELLASQKSMNRRNAEIQDYADFSTDFFNIFGVRRRSVSIYQKAVQKINGNTGFINLFWPSVLLVEHKSKGENLDSAFLQASDYILGLPEEERPRYVIVSDFEQFVYMISKRKVKKLKFTISRYQNSRRIYASLDL